MPTGGPDSATIVGGKVVTVNTAQSILNLINSGGVNIDAASLTLAGGGSTNNTGGVINIANASVLNQFGQAITGGTINTTGSGKLVANSSAANFLNGVTLNGNLDLASIVNSRERVTAGGLVLNGIIDLNNNAILSFEGDGTLSGAATIVLGATGPGNRIDLDGNGTTTFGSGITVRGQNGTIGQQINLGGTQTLVNNGLISADVAGGTVTLTESAVTNNGTLSALNGGTLVLSSNVTGGGTGQIVAGAGSTVLQNGVTLSGNINTSGSGLFSVISSSANFLNGVTLNGNLDMASIANSRERVSTGGLVLNGTVNINQNGILSFEGTQTLGGTGSIVLGATGPGNRIDLDGTGTTTFGSGITVRGQNGTIGQQINIGGTQTLANNGTINSDGGGTITLATDGTITNNGTMRAQNGTLTIQNALAGTGTLRVDSTGVMNLANSPNTQGQLVMGGAGSVLNIGTQNLTINSDYTNAASGIGNSFNNRAGISGAGLVLAGGDAAQAITGAGVSNGATTNATLTLGNVRVGATTFDYQIANTGATGPSLRGAIQTSVNGANITDTRLSGTGVTASNYNTGAPGSNTGNLGVTFTAASAGALAPLGGQVLNLRSNFSDIPDQKLNIVLGAGAAAFNAAVGSTTPSPVVVANQRIGGIQTAALTVSNTAAAGAFSEDLNASFGANTGAVSNNGGSVNGLLAGASNGAAMNVGVNTATAGAKTGTVTLAYQTVGAVNGVSNGLGTASVGSQTINVSGNVYQIAQPSFGTTNVVFANRHVGDAASQAVSITNTNVAPGFQEGLSAAISGVSGNATGSGAITNLAAGSSSGAIAVGLDTSSAGARSGTVNVGLTSTGAGTSGLTDLALGAQAVTVTGNVYRLAAANTLAPTINFGNVLIGSVQAQALGIQNTAANDSFSERLDARFLVGGTTGDASNNGGSISLLGAGATDATSMAVGISTASIGAKTGQVIVAFDSNGLGTSGLGITALANQTLSVLANVTGVVGTLAQPSAVTPNPVNFGNVRIGAAPLSQVLSISNLAVIGEGLNASISTASAGFGATGAFASLAPGATNNSALQVQFTGTATAGAKSGSATVALVSDGTFNGGVTTTLPSQTVNMSGNVYRLASPVLDTTAVTLAARRGDASPSAAVGITNASPDMFTEGLKAGISTASAGFNASGAIANLSAGSSDAASLSVGLDTSSAGATSGSATVAFTSTGAGTTGAADVSVGSAPVSLVGRVYEAAVAQVNTTLVNFGIVHVGDAVASKTVDVSNAAPVAGLNDTLKGSISTSAAGFSATGSFSGLAAGTSNTSSLLVDLNTTTAGFYSGSAGVAFASSNPDMADLALGTQSVALSAQINNYADADLRKTGGTGSLSAVGDVYTFDFGTLVQGSGVRSAMLEVFNDVFGPSDLLDGQFSAVDTNDFGYLASFFDIFVDLDAGQAQGGFGISFDPVTLGLVSDSVALASLGHNSSGYSGALGPITLLFTAKVITGGGGTGTVPVPGTLLLVASALLALAALRRRGVGVH